MCYLVRAPTSSNKTYSNLGGITVLVMTYDWQMSFPMCLSGVRHYQGVLLQT